MSDHVRTVLLDILRASHPIGVPENSLVTEAIERSTDLDEEGASGILYEMIAGGLVEWEPFDESDPLVCRLPMQRGGTA